MTARVISKLYYKFPKGTRLTSHVCTFEIKCPQPTSSVRARAIHDTFYKRNKKNFSSSIVELSKHLGIFSEHSRSAKRIRPRLVLFRATRVFLKIPNCLYNSTCSRKKFFYFFCNRHETYLIKWLQQAEILDAIQISMWRIKRHLGEHLACRTGVTFLGFQANGSRRELGAKCESVEGLNVKTVLNVMTFGPKCNDIWS